MNDLIHELEGIFNEVKDQEMVFENLKDGDYLAVVEDVIVGESKMEKPMVTFVFAITHGDSAGRTHRKFLLLSGKDESQLRQNLNRYATEVKKYGIDTSKGLQNTFDQLHTVRGREVKLTISTTVSKNTGTKFTNTSVELL